MQSHNQVIINLMGGLGNQLFIYAAGLALAKRNNAELYLNNFSGYRRDGYRREYLLDHYCISAPIANHWDCFRGYSGRVRRVILRSINQRYPFCKRSYLQEGGAAFIPELLTYSVRGKVWLEGYWQNQCYFQDVETLLRNELRLARPLSDLDSQLADEIDSSPSIGVHIRTFREVPGNNYERPPAPAFYECAVRAALIKEPDARIFCFSDDVEWVRNNVQLPGMVTFVMHNVKNINTGAPYDLWLLSRCQHLVLSNSSFSWWAGWLANHPGQIWISADHSWPNTVAFAKTLIKFNTSNRCKG